jgi:hypothetical protein
MIGGVAAATKSGNLKPTSRPCARCGAPFTPTAAQLAKGYGLYCSRSCSNKAHAVHAPAEPRPCAHCGEMFAPAAAELAAGKGRYCSIECKREALRVHPRPEPRPCAACGKSFTPRGVDVARGKGRYCSIECKRAGQRVHPEPRPRPCAHCGTTFTPRPENVAIGRGRYCTSSCWTLDRWRCGIALARVVAPFPGLARKKWGRKWGAFRGGSEGGKQRGYTDHQAREVRTIKQDHPSFGRDAIAGMTGLTAKQVRAILTETARESGP